MSEGEEDLRFRIGSWVCAEEWHEKKVSPASRLSITSYYPVWRIHRELKH